MASCHRTCTGLEACHFAELSKPANLRCNYYNFIQQIGKVNPYLGEKFLLKNNYFYIMFRGIILKEASCLMRSVQYFHKCCRGIIVTFL